MKVLRWIGKSLPFLYMGFIWYLSDRPADAVVNFPVYDGFIKESLHLVEFAILYGLFVLFFVVDGKLSKKTNLVAAIIASLYGLVDEVHQYFVPNRSATVIDLVKDVLGVTIAYWIVHRGYFVKKNKVGEWIDSVGELFQKKKSA